jgi:hypothetical protein
MSVSASVFLLSLVSRKRVPTFFNISSLVWYFTQEKNAQLLLSLKQFTILIMYYIWLDKAWNSLSADANSSKLTRGSFYGCTNRRDGVTLFDQSSVEKKRFFMQKNIKTGLLKNGFSHVCPSIFLKATYYQLLRFVFQEKPNWGFSLWQEATLG